MQTVQDLMDVIHQSEPYVPSYGDIVFKMDIHNSYMVERLSVYATCNTDDVDIRRIYVPETKLREVAMHVVDCIERVDGTTDVTWQSVLEHLSKFIDKSNVGKGE